MTASRSPAELAEAYARPPYRTPPPPPRTPQDPVWDILLPWRLARLVYGPYRILRLTASGVTSAVGADLLNPYVQPVAATVAAQTLAPAVERVLMPRVLLGAGVARYLVRMVTGIGTTNDLLDATLGDSVVMLLMGPIALLIGCTPLVALAYPGTRRQVARLVVRPLLVGVFTALLFAAMMLSSADGLDYSAGGTGLVALLMLWWGPFILCVLYLVQRNSFAVRAQPLVRPLVAVPLVWLTALGHVWLVDPRGTYSHSPGLVALIAGPIGVTVTAVVEVVLLRRRQRVGFRGPLGPAPAPTATSYRQGRVRQGRQACPPG